jgi:hypothetical protein
MTINYAEKGIGLHQAIAAAGHALAQIDGAWVSSDDVAVQAIIDDYTLDTARHEKSVLVSAHAKALRDKVVAAISAGEMASWPIKASEAAKFAASGDASQCPMLSGEAASRGVTVAELVGKVNGNAARFIAAEAAIGGTDGKHRDAIAQLATFEAVAAYDFSTGWPAV